jgi:2-isopropylmalate synthase
MTAPDPDYVFLFDTTLRDGAQTQGVDFSAGDKVHIAKELDALGIDYIEGGWPGANPTDDAFFADPPILKRARFASFGMTRRPGRSAANDPGLAAVLGVKAKAAVLVGKTWDFHVETALGATLKENLDMVADSVALARQRLGEALFDAEHFFDGYKANPAYALDCLKAAHRAGARWIVLCDTNGGTLPSEVHSIVGEAACVVPGTQLGIHAHNDTENAVANSLAAVEAGARMIQGTLNGLGERCGNANLCSIIPCLKLKTRFAIGVGDQELSRLTHVSRLLDELLNRAPNRRQPFVGESAFAHKGGLHVSAVTKDPRTYEHIAPERVGNRRHVVVSDQAGRSNILERLREAGIEVAPDHPKIARLVETVKSREFDGYAYDGAEASFELLARDLLEGLPRYYEMESFKVDIERRYNAKGKLVTLAQAVTKLAVGNERFMEVGEGVGPVDALSHAMMKALLKPYPGLAEMRLTDFKVRIVTPQAGTAAVTRVMIESGDASGERWSTVGLSANIIDASYEALRDAIYYKLLRNGVKPAA